MKICLFGSSFNPPHLGHLQIVEGLKQMEFDQILIVPTGNPNHKQIEIATDDRLALITEFAKLCQVEVSLHEIENKFEYTVESLEYLNFDRDVQIYFTIGSDSVNTLPTWDQFERLSQMVTFVVVNRPGIEIDESVLAQINYIKLDIKTADISSSQLRAHIDPRYLPQPIYQTIIDRQLYNQ